MQFLLCLFLIFQSVFFRRFDAVKDPRLERVKLLYLLIIENAVQLFKKLFSGTVYLLIAEFSAFGEFQTDRTASTFCDAEIAFPFERIGKLLDILP